jgi:hypothetical protein
VSSTKVQLNLKHLVKFYGFIFCCNCGIFILCRVFILYIVVIIVVFSFCVGCSLCVFLCTVFRLIVVLFCVMCVVCVLCLIVVPLPPDENPFAVKIYIYIFNFLRIQCFILRC